MALPLTGPHASGTRMSIVLTSAEKEQAIASIERYFESELGERIGNIEAGALLRFVIEEIGPSLYNRGVADAQARLAARVEELDIELYEEAFTWWTQPRR